jgi:hypothetical protein
MQQWSVTQRETDKMTQQVRVLPAGLMAEFNPQVQVKVEGKKQLHSGHATSVNICGMCISAFTYALHTHTHTQPQ